MLQRYLVRAKKIAPSQWETEIEFVDSIHHKDKDEWIEESTTYKGVVFSPLSPAEMELKSITTYAKDASLYVGFWVQINQAGFELSTHQHFYLEGDGGPDNTASEGDVPSLQKP